MPVQVLDSCHTVSYTQKFTAQLADGLISSIAVMEAERADVSARITSYLRSTLSAKRDFCLLRYIRAMCKTLNIPLPGPSFPLRRTTRLLGDILVFWEEKAKTKIDLFEIYRRISPELVYECWGGIIYWGNGGYRGQALRYGWIWKFFGNCGKRYDSTSEFEMSKKTVRAIINGNSINVPRVTRK